MSKHLAPILSVLVFLAILAPVRARAGDAPAPWKGFTVQTPDGNAELRVGGLVQADGVFLIEDRRDQNNRFELRRMRVFLEAKLWKRFAARIQTQFTPSGVAMLDVHADAIITDWLTLRMGKQKAPLGIEMLQAPTCLFLPERGLSTSLVPVRDLGVQLFGGVADGLFSYGLGVFNGAADGDNVEVNVDDNVDVDARVFFQPFRGLGIAGLKSLGVGVGGSWGLEEGDATLTGLGKHRTVTRENWLTYADGVFADGTRWRVNPHLWYYWGPVGVLGEFVMSSQRVKVGEAHRVLDRMAWVAGGSWVITGEDASFKGVVPRRAWGALELAARYGEVRVADAADAFADGILTAGMPGLARSWGVGLHYWAVASAVRASLAFEQTMFEAAGGVARASENALFLRFQIAP